MVLGENILSEWISWWFLPRASKELDLPFSFWLGGVRGLCNPSPFMPSYLATRSMMPLLMRREVRRVLAVSPSDIQPCDAAALSSKVMKVGVDRALSGWSRSRYWPTPMLLG